MGKDLAEADPAARARFDQAAQALGWDVSRVCFEGPEEELTRSDRAQPAILVHSLVCFEAFRAKRPDVRFSAAAGLSSGEWTALTAAGVLPLEDTLRILQVRGRAMQAACERRPGGMMSVLGLAPEVLAEICAKSGAEIANLLSPEQTVLSGTAEALTAAETLAAGRGVRKTIRLNVAGAFHSTLMREAADELAAALATVRFQAPAFPVYSNVTGKPHGSPDEVREAMKAQVYSSVQWVRTIQALRAGGVADFIEMGPGRVLSGLIKRIDKTSNLHNIQDLAGLAAVGSGFVV
jgi:[acyl-carrier-protein] S-malonyltransferase